MPVLTVPKELRDPLGDKGADALVEFFNEANNEQKENIIEIVEEHFEARLTVAISNLDKKLSKEISDLRVEMKEGNANLRGDLTGKIEGVQSNLIKWMFIFWTGQIVVLTAIMLAFQK